MRHLPATRLVAAALIAAAALVSAPAVSAAPAGITTAVSASRATDTALGTRLVNRFFTMLVDQDTTALAAFLSPAFQVVRANGTKSTKAAYLQDPPVVESYDLSDVVVTRRGNVLVTTYQVVTTETIDGQALSTSPAPRMSVFMRDAALDRWQLVAHANLNPPA